MSPACLSSCVRSPRRLPRRFRSRAVLELENLALRHQLHVLRRQRPGRPRLFTLDRLLWVRCGGKLERALRVADLVLQGGGFGITVLDLAGVPPQWVRRIPMAYWFRFRRAVENKPCCCILVDQTPCAGTCAAFLLEMRRDETVWSGPPEFRLLTSVRFNVRKKKPMGLQECAFESRAETGICNVSVTRGPRRVAPASRRH